MSAPRASHRGLARLARRAALLAGLLAQPACLEHAREAPGYSPHILEPGARVPEVADDERMAMRIASQAGASGPRVALRTGYADGVELAYWDFGAQPSSVKPVWLLERAGERIDHPPLVDSLPGDSAYSPFRQVFTVQVSARYAGERLSSLAALEDAIALGLVADPEPTATYVSWPIVPEGFELERNDGEPLGTELIYGAGWSARYLPIGDATPLERAVPTGTLYTLRRQNEPVELDEAARGADLNGDGDRLDSNAIFELGDGDGPPSGLWSVTAITVASDYAFGAYRASEDLFARDAAGTPEPVPGAFIAQEPTGQTLYRPLHPPLHPMEEP